MSRQSDRDLDRAEHRQRTLDYFRRAAAEKDGFYDCSDSTQLGPSRWQSRVRAHLDGACSRVAGDVRSFLDVACGNGDYIRELADRYPEISFRGHDFSGEMIELARNDAGERSNLEYHARDLLELDEALGSFDVVLCLNMFHHLHRKDADRALDALAALTRKHLFFEIKGDDNLWNRYFRPNSEFPVTLVAPMHVREYLGARGLRFVDRWNLFGFAFLSPISVLEFERE